MKRLASKKQLSLDDFKFKARKKETAQCSMVPESVAAECFPNGDAQANKIPGKTDSIKYFLTMTIYCLLCNFLMKTECCSWNLSSSGFCL